MPTKQVVSNQPLVVKQLDGISRKMLQIDHSQNRRFYMGDLKMLGSSMDKNGQTNPLICTQTKKQHLRVWDGHRRIKTSDEGFCPQFTARDSWRVETLFRADGSVPSRIEIERWCAETNIVRNNWSVIEDARYYQLELQEALAGRRDTKGEIKARVIKELAQQRNCSTRTIRYRLSLLKLPHRDQMLIAKKHLSPNAVLRLVEQNLPSEEIEAIIEEAAKESGLGITEEATLVKLESPSEETTNGTAPTKIPRIKSGAVETVMRRRGTSRNPHKLRPITWFQEELTRAKDLAKKPSPEQEAAKLYVQFLRAALSETEKLPV